MPEGQEQRKKGKTDQQQSNAEALRREIQRKQREQQRKQDRKGKG